MAKKKKQRLTMDELAERAKAFLKNKELTKDNRSLFNKAISKAATKKQPD